ncbi:MAG: DUF885 domain-containing protein [Planctomycetales bacterium]|nr:DUF885 domain-containing protein [Planctomycetales bacterium]
MKRFYHDPATLTHTMTAAFVALTILLATGELSQCYAQPVNDARGKQSAEANAADARFRAIADAWWEDAVKRDPLFATATGDNRWNDKLPVVSIAAYAARAEQLREFQSELTSLDVEQLSLGQRVNYAVVRRWIETELAEHEYQADLIPITNREGFHIFFPELRNQMPLRSLNDYHNYIARLKGFAEYSRQHMELMRAGIAAGMTLPSVVMQRFRESIEPHIVDDADASLFFEPLRKLPATISADDAEELRAAARQAIRDSIVPGYRDFLTFMADEYVPACRSSVGASSLPQGRAFYRHRVRRFTTLDLTPEEVHATGMSEVKRIRAEMETLARRVGHEGSLEEFMSALREDTRFHPASADALLKEAALILKRVDGKLPQLFRVLPRTPYGLQPIPDYVAPATTSAYYMPPPGDGTRAGYYCLNTFDLKSRPLYELEALSLHEAVPGHHLQIALQQELSDLPPYRRFAEFTAFVEGWALYAERLGLEIGFYEDPYSDFGRLTYEMWRACRLVVDTGIHYLGWTREQAIRFMEQNTALSLHNIRAEVDRYIAWPGQALGYKMGELQIRRLRADAEQSLGARFDVREFHDIVLRNGALPLDVLERNVRDWIKTK